MENGIFEKDLKAFSEFQRKSHALYHAMSLLFVDGDTVAPKDSVEGRGITLSVLTEMAYSLAQDDEMVALVERLYENRSLLSSEIARQVELIHKENEQMLKIPKEEYIAYRSLLNDSQAVWEEAKVNNDFASFAPYLEKIVAYNIRLAGYINPDMKPYDALLDQYEEGLTTETLDAFFKQLREAIVPLLRRVMERPVPDDSFLHASYPVPLQREFSKWLMDLIGIDPNRCVLAETEHPFTDNFNNHDVRITTHYHEYDLLSNAFSVIHEGGHAIYEMDIRDEYNYTALSGGISMSIHESQSRFYENYIARSRSFTDIIFEKARELFPIQLASVSSDDFYRAANKVEPSLIRTEADELTYCLHIMVRYEIEKMLISGTLAVRDVPAKWNELYEEYLGITVPDDTHGCLQDCHWAGGSIAYFPSYALGSAYGAQMLSCMEKANPNLFESISRGDLSPAREWLKENIHQYGKLFGSTELFEKACGKFDASYYISYLYKKYAALYDIAL